MAHGGFWLEPKYPKSRVYTFQTGPTTILVSIFLESVTGNLFLTVVYQPQFFIFELTFLLRTELQARKGERKAHRRIPRVFARERCFFTSLDQGRDELAARTSVPDRI
jgi:hypothetical protein